MCKTTDNEEEYIFITAKGEEYIRALNTEYSYSKNKRRKFNSIEDEDIRPVIYIEPTKKRDKSFDNTLVVVLGILAVCFILWVYVTK